MNKLGGMFEYYSVYKDMSNYERSKSIAAHELDMEVDILKQLGFIYHSKNNDSRYNETFKLPSENNIVVYTDGTWSRIVDTRTCEKYGDIYNPRQFIKCWNSLSDNKISIDKFSSISRFEVEYDLYRERLIKNDNKTLSTWSDFTTIDGYFAHHYKLWNKFEERYKELIKAGKLKEEFVVYSYFYWAMYNCNRFFFPNILGSQWGDYDATLQLACLTKAISEQHIQERIEMFGDDY